VWRESHIIEARSGLNDYYFTRLLEQKQDPLTIAAIQVAYRQGHFKVEEWAICQSLLCIVNGPGLADDCNLDLARILQAFFHFLGDIFGQLD